MPISRCRKFFLHHLASHSVCRRKHLRVCALSRRLFSVIFRSNPIRQRYSNSEACLGQAGQHHVIFFTASEQELVVSHCALHTPFRYLPDGPSHSSPMSKSSLKENGWRDSRQELHNTVRHMLGKLERKTSLPPLDKRRCAGRRCRRWRTPRQTGHLGGGEDGTIVIPSLFALLGLVHTLASALSRLSGRSWLLSAGGGAFQAASLSLSSDPFLAGGFLKFC